MGPNGPHSEFILLVSTTYEGWMGSQHYSLLCKNILVIMQGCTRISEWYV